MKKYNYASNQLGEIDKIFYKVGSVLQQGDVRKDGKSGIIDLSQGDPIGEPLDIVHQEMARASKYEPLGKYSFYSTTPLLLISALRYLSANGMDYKKLVNAAPKGFYSNKDILEKNIRNIDDLLWDSDISGDKLFITHYYHQMSTEQHLPTLQDNQQKYDVQKLIGELKQQNPDFKFDIAAAKYEKLIDAIRYLEIIGGTGNCKEAFFNSIELFSGKKILSGNGIYHAFSGIPYITGKEWEIIDTTDTKDYKLTPYHLQKWFNENPDQIDNINSVALENPSNPSGAIYNKEELQALTDFCRSKSIPIIVDAVYSGLKIKPDAHFIPISEIYPDGSISFKSMGKVFTAPGLRVGFAYGYPDFMRRFNKNISDLKGFLPIPADIGAAAIMEYTPQSYYARNNEIYRERMNFIKERVNQANRQINSLLNNEINKFNISSDDTDKIELNSPQGGYFMLMSLPFMKGRYYKYKDQNTNKYRCAQITGSLDLTRMFIHHLDKNGNEQGVRVPPTTSQAIPDSLCQLRISVGRDNKEALNKGFNRIENVIMDTLSEQKSLKVLYEKQGTENVISLQ